MPNLEIGFTDPAIGRYTPVRPISQCIPEWYKKLPVYSNQASKCPVQRIFAGEVPSIKLCPPVYDYIHSGYMIPWVYETFFQRAMNGEGIYNVNYYSAEPRYVSHHTNNQLPELKTDFFKINIPFTFKTSKGYSCLFYQPFYHFEEQYSLLPAIIDTDKFHNASIVGYMKQDNIKVSPNDPMICIFPFKREEFTHTLKQITKDEAGNSVRGLKDWIRYGIKTKGEHSFYTLGSYRLLSWTKKIFK
jgi:hypothetical protein